MRPLEISILTQKMIMNGLTTIDINIALAWRWIVDKLYTEPMHMCKTSLGKWWGGDGG